jgi:hypothetical protein
MDLRLLENWQGVIEQTVGSDLPKDKQAFIATICQLQENFENIHNGSLNENNQFATLGSVNGMGAVKLPTQTSNGWGGGAGDPTNGSGDVPYSLLPLAIQVAAQTIGLELVPTQPMNAPVGMISYMDYVYAGGKNGYAPMNDLYVKGTDGTPPNSPIYVKADVEVSGWEKGGVGEIDNAGATLSVTYMGQSRIDGYAIFKLPRELAAGTSVASYFPAGGTGATAEIGGTAYAVESKAELVKALEDHIADFSNNAGATSTDAMSRLEGETTPANVGNLQLFSKSVEAKTIQAAAAVTREQLMDLRQFGIDAVAQSNQFLANEMTQTINKDILSNIFELGKTNHENLEAVSGSNQHLVLGVTNADLTIGTAPLNTADWLYFGAGRTVKQVDAANLGAENLGTRQRRLMSRMLNVSNIISVRGRRGPATFAVCSLTTASGFQDCSGFVPYPMANTLNQVPGALYPLGTLAGIAIYVDPNMAFNDGRIAVGRKGDGASPGLIFMPYVMADTVETIAEGTMAPKLQMKSRYALVHAGHHPETMYLTFGALNTVDGGWA